MACACRGRKKSVQFLWYDPTNPEGVQPIIYNSELEARAKVIRKPGTRYITYDPNEPVGTQIMIAETALAEAALAES